MNGRSIVTALGAGITTFLLVAVLVIELLAIEFSAIVGLPVGLLAGVFVVVGVLVGGAETNPGIRRAVRAYAAFGWTILILLALAYVNVGQFSVAVVAGAAGVVACGTYIVLYVVDRNQTR